MRASNFKAMRLLEYIMDTPHIFLKTDYRMVIRNILPHELATLCALQERLIKHYSVHPRSLVPN